MCEVQRIPEKSLQCGKRLAARKMSKKALGVVIKLVSMANTGYFYTTMKNARLPKKLLLRKYDPVVRQHVLFKVRRMCLLCDSFLLSSL